MAANLASMGMALISIPLLTTRLGMAGMADYMILMAIVAMGWVVVDYSFELGSLRDLVKLNDSSARSSLLVEVYLGKGLLTVVAAPAAGFLAMTHAWLRHQPAWMEAGMAVTFAVACRFPLCGWYLIGTGESRYMALVTVWTRGFFVVSCWFWIHAPEEALRAVMFNGAAWFFAGILMLFVGAHPTIDLPIRHWIPKALSSLSGGFRLFAAGFLGNVFGQGSMIVVGAFCPASIAVEYGIWEKMFRLIGGSFSPLAQGVMPKIRKGTESIRPRKLIFFAFSVWVIVAIMGVALGSFAYQRLSHGIAPLHIGLWWILLIASGFTMMNVLMHPFVLLHGRDRSLLSLYGFLALGFLFLGPFSVLLMHAYGMAVVLLLIEITIGAVYLRWLRRGEEPLVVLKPDIGPSKPRHSCPD